MPPDPPRWLLALAFEAHLPPTNAVVEHSPPLLTSISSYKISGSVPISHACQRLSSYAILHYMHATDWYIELYAVATGYMYVHCISIIMLCQNGTYGG